jgi:hypothetical protein
MLFSRYFLGLFSELKNLSIKLAIMDLLMCLGSGSQTSTLLNHTQVSIHFQETDQTLQPLCRTS